MKRSIASIFAWAGMAAGIFLTGGAAHAAIADYAGSYAANLASSETPPGGGDPVDMFYGRLEFSVNAKSGVATGTLQTRAGKSYPVSAKFMDAMGEAVVSDKTGQNNVALAKIKGSSAFAINFSLTINADGTVEAAGTNTASGDANGDFFVSRSYKFTKFTGKVDSQPAWTGNYTLALVAPESAGDDVPAGAGYASLSVNTTGKLSYKGKLGDGTTLTGSANPIDGAVYSLFVKPAGYAAGGYFVAELDLDQRGELAEPALWNKEPKPADKGYPAGFSTEPIVVIQPWTVPAAKTFPLPTALGFGNSKNFEVDFSGDGLLAGDVATLPEVARITSSGLVQAVAGGTGAPADNNSKAWNAFWKNVKVDPKTGVFSGKQVLRRTVGSKTSNLEADVGGVFSLPTVLGSEPFAFGQYVVKTSSSTTTGFVTFSGPLEDNKFLAAAGTYEFLLRRQLTSGTVKNVPADNTWATIVLSEDMQSVKFAGRTFPLTGVESLYLSYSNKGGSVTIYRNTTTGAFTSIQGIVGSGANQVIFNTQNPAESNIRRVP